MRRMTRLQCLAFLAMANLVTAVLGAESATNQPTAGAATLAQTGTGAAVFALQKNDVIHVYGDSTTVEGNAPAGYVTLLRQAITEQAPEMNVQVVGVGRWGAESGALIGSVRAGLAAKPKPTVVVMNYGLNDSRGGPKAALKAVPVYVANVRQSIEEARQGGLRVLLCTPMTWGGTEQTKPLAAAARELAAEMSVPLVDLNAVHVAYLVANRDPLRPPTADGVHLSSWGNRLTAETLLQAMGLKPQWKQYPVCFQVDYATRQPRTGKATVTIEPAKSHYAPGEKITVTAVPEDGWIFDRWLDGTHGTDNPQTITVDGPLRFVARMIPKPDPAKGDSTKAK